MREPSGASWWNRTSCSRIAGNTRTGMLTSPKLTDPVQMERATTHPPRRIGLIVPVRQAGEPEQRLLPALWLSPRAAAGRGGMADFDRAEDREAGRSPSTAGGRRGHRRAPLSPGVVNLHATGSRDGVPYLATALVEGPSLRDQLAAAVARQLARRRLAGVPPGCVHTVV